MLTNLETILADTREKHYAVGLFNCVTLEMTKGILAAAEELCSPVIIGPAESLLPGATLAEYADMMLGMVKRAKVPVAQLFMANFDQVYNLYNNFVLSTGDVLPTYIYRISLGGGGAKFELSTAANLLMSSLGLVAVLATNKFVKKLDVMGIF